MTTTYRVYRNGSLISSPTVLTYHDTGLVNGTPYTYQVSAVNELGEGALSNAVVVTPGVPFYGPAFGADDLNNTPIGTSSVTKSSYRFRAEQSSALNSARFYIIANGNTGYSNGTGGTIRLDVFADDGTAAHAPAGTSKANGSVAPGNPDPTAGFHTVVFGVPPALVAGTLYHIQFSNTDASPTVNFCSIDNIFNYGTADVPYQPKWPNTDMAELVKYGGGAWSDSRGPGAGVNTPILQLAYANGQYQGQGYIELSGQGDAGDGFFTCDGTVRFRETFTVSSGTRQVSGCYVRLAHTTGSGSTPLTVRLETGAGVNVVTGTIAAANIADHAKTGRSAGPKWAFCDFGGLFTITNGATYHLQFSTSAGTEYWIRAMRQGADYTFQPVTYYSDGNAQIDYGLGGGWTNVKNQSGSPNPNYNFPWYLA